MKKAMRKTLALVAVLTILASAMTGAFALEYPSRVFKLPSVKYRPVASPAPAETPAPSVEPTAQPAVTPEPAPTPVPVPTYVKDANGALVLDAQGNPILEGAAEGAVNTTTYMRNPNGELMLDALGNPIPVVETPAQPETPAEPEASAPLNPTVTIFSTHEDNMAPGETVYLGSTITGLDGYELTYQWECDDGSGIFLPVPGATADTYSFEATIENLAYDWRLVVYYEV